MEMTQCEANEITYAYLIKRSPIAKDEIYRTLDETLSEVMPPFLIKQRILGTINSTTIKSCLISGHPQRHCLCTDITGKRPRRHVLLLITQSHPFSFIHYIYIYIYININLYLSLRKDERKITWKLMLKALKLKAKIAMV